MCMSVRPNLCNITPSLISQKPTEQMCLVQISLLVVTFPFQITQLLTLK